MFVTLANIFKKMFDIILIAIYLFQQTWLLEQHSEFTIDYFWILFIKYHIFVGLWTKLICIKLYFVILNIIISLLLQYSDTIDVHKRLTTEGIQRGLATIHCYDNGTSFLGTGRSHGTCNSSRLLTTKINKIYIFCC